MSLEKEEDTSAVLAPAVEVKEYNLMEDAEEDGDIQSADGKAIEPVLMGGLQKEMEEEGQQLLVGNSSVTPDPTRAQLINAADKADIILSQANNNNQDSSNYVVDDDPGFVGQSELFSS